MRSVSEVVDHFKESWISELSEGRIEQACHDSGMNWISSLRTVVKNLLISPFLGKLEIPNVSAKLPTNTNRQNTF